MGNLRKIEKSEIQIRDVEKSRLFSVQTGILSSALEHGTPELMFTSDVVNDPQPDSISAVKAIQKASESGQRIYQITRDNMIELLPNINHDSSTMNEIRASLNAGKQVLTHTDNISIPGWTGAGYIILDPVTGSGAFKISGGANGGVEAADKIVMILGLYTDFKESIADLAGVDLRNSKIGKFMHLTSKFFGILGFGIAALDIAGSYTGEGVYLTMYIFIMLTLMTLVAGAFIANPLIGFIFAAAAATAINQLISHLKETIVCKA